MARGGGQVQEQAASGDVTHDADGETQAPDTPEAQIASEDVAEEIVWPTCGRVVQVRVNGEGHEDVVDNDWRPGVVVVSDLEVALVNVFLLDDDVPFSGKTGLWRGTYGFFYRLRPGNEGDDVGCWRWPPRV